MQRHTNNEKTSGAKGELRTVQGLIAFSFLVHILVFWIDPSGWISPTPLPLLPEWEMEAELSIDAGFAMQVPAPPSPIAKETTPPPPPEVSKEILPQLPKKITIKDHEEAAITEPDSTDAKPVETPAPAKDEPAPIPKPADSAKKPAPQLAIKKDDEATELFKKDLMDRLLREQQRQEDRKRKKQEAALKESLKARKVITAKLAELKREVTSSAGSGGSHATINETHPYIVAVKGYIYENYSIPQVYNFEDTEAPIVLFVVNSSGDLVKSDVYQSSHNSALDQYALKSLLEAAPFFPKPPPEIVGRPIQIRFQRRI